MQDIISRKKSRNGLSSGCLIFWQNNKEIGKVSTVITPLSQFISLSVLVGTFTSLVLAWFVFYRGLLRLELTGKKRITVTLATGAVLLAWFFLAFFLARQGFFEAAPSATPQFPNIVFTFLPLVFGLLLLSFSKSFRRLVDALPLRWLIGIQLYRILGIFFIISYAQGLLPGEFAIPAGVGDMLVGIAAPFVAYFYFTRKQWARKLAVLWNVVGIGDLIVAVTLGFLTSPGPFQLLALDEPNLLITAYPLVMVPAFGVPLSILLHIFALRILRRSTL